MADFFADNLDGGALSERLKGLIEGELEDAEDIRWIGQPTPRLFARRSLPIVLFGIPWTAFAVFWIAGAAGFKVPNFNQGADLFPLFGIPFVLIGFGMLSAPLWMLRKSRRTVYVVTDRRAIIFDGGLHSTTIRSYWAAAHLGDLRRNQRDDGFGDLIFDRRVSHDSDGKAQQTDVGFFAIPEVKAVENLVRGILVK